MDDEQSETLAKTTSLGLLDDSIGRFDDATAPSEVAPEVASAQAAALAAHGAGK